MGLDRVPMPAGPPPGMSVGWKTASRTVLVEHLGRMPFDTKAPAVVNIQLAAPM